MLNRLIINYIQFKPRGSLLVLLYKDNKGLNLSTATYIVEIKLFKRCCSNIIKIIFIISKLLNLNKFLPKTNFIS